MSAASHGRRIQAAVGRTLISKSSTAPPPRRVITPLLKLVPAKLRAARNFELDDATSPADSSRMVNTHTAPMHNARKRPGIIILGTKASRAFH